MNLCSVGSEKAAWSDAEYEFFTCVFEKIAITDSNFLTKMSHKVQCCYSFRLVYNKPIRTRMRLAHVSSMHVSFDQLQQVVFHGQSTKMLVCCFSVKTSKSQEFLVKELLFSETQLRVHYCRWLYEDAD